jgi:hypothetical protein
VLLPFATCLATYLAILLWPKLHANLQSVTYLAIIKSRNIFVATSIAQSRIRFYFSQRPRQRIFRALHRVTSLLQVATSLAIFIHWMASWFALLTVNRASQTLAPAVFILFLIMIFASCMEHIAWCIPCNSFFLTLRDKLFSVTAP